MWGDADSTAAIVGGIIGASVGKEGIPSGWRDTLIEWPLSVAYLENLGASLFASSEDENPSLPYWPPYWQRLLRNLFFLLVVLCHGVRRLLPPF